MLGLPACAGALESVDDAANLLVPVCSQLQVCHMSGMNRVDRQLRLLLCKRCGDAAPKLNCTPAHRCQYSGCRSSPTGLSAATQIGVSVTVGAGSLLRSCKIEDLVIIGERCVIMEGSVIKSHSMLQPGTVVPPAKLIPSGQLWGGCPAQFIRKLTHDEVRPPPL